MNSSVVQFLKLLMLKLLIMLVVVQYIHGDDLMIKIVETHSLKLLFAHHILMKMGVSLLKILRLVQIS